MDPPRQRASPVDAVAGDQPASSRKRGRETSDEFSDVRRALQAMETTFITIHDLSPDARILYCSQSVSDVLEWKPEEIRGKPCWEYFHPDEIPFARAIHGRGVQLDKASVLNYCRIKNKYGEYVGCECVFTVVYNVLIGCTSVYMDGPKAKKRAVEAPIVRQLFSSSPRDPRYHMLSYISAKFSSGPRPHLHEPRAALFLNRFTRTLTINFATNGLEDILGVEAEALIGNSFYYCLQENCLAEAIRCLESAKANDSIAYLRFWFRDPREDGSRQHDEIIDGEDGSSSEDEEGGVQLGPPLQVDRRGSEQALHSDSSAPSSAKGGPPRLQRLGPGAGGDDSRHSSGNSTDMGQESANAMFDQSPERRPSTPRSAMSLDSPVMQHSSHRSGMANGDSLNGIESVPRHGASQIQQPQQTPLPRRDIEIEAVVSCTSDGLVVIMRSARPFVPDSVRAPPQRPYMPYSNGLFASPWATNPIMPDPTRFPSYIPTSSYQAAHPTSVGLGAGWRNSQFAQNQLVPRYGGQVAPHIPTQAPTPAGPPLVDFMNSIRDVAVFAWALTGINGSLQQFGRGRPLMGAVPHSGLPVWDPDGRMAKKEAAARERQRQHDDDGIDGDDVEDHPRKGSADRIGDRNQNGLLDDIDGHSHKMLPDGISGHAQNKKTQHDGYHVERPDGARKGHPQNDLQSSSTVFLEGSTPTMDGKRPDVQEQEVNPEPSAVQ